MKVGSLVVMTKPLGEDAVSYLIRKGVDRWPTPGSDVCEVESIAPGQDPANKEFLYLDLHEYRNISCKGLHINIDYFTEIQPPDAVDIEELLKIPELVNCHV